LQHNLTQRNTPYVTVNNKVTNYDLGLIYGTGRSWLKAKTLTHGIKKYMYVYDTRWAG